MDNNFLSSLFKMLSSGFNFSGNPSTSQAQTQEKQNPAYYGYPKEAYSISQEPPQNTNNSVFNIENLLALLAGNKGNLSSILSNVAGKNSPLASLASLMTNNKKEEETPLPEKEILL